MADVKWSDDSVFTPVGHVQTGDQIMGLRSGLNVKFNGVTSTGLQETYDSGNNAEINLSDSRPIVVNSISDGSNTNGVTTPSTGTNTVSNYRVLGWVFNVSDPINITGLQYQDSHFSSGTRDVGIFVKSTQELLGSINVSKTDPLVGPYRTTVLSNPISLQPGIDYICATVVPAGEANNLNSDAVPSAEITITERCSGNASSFPIPLSFPTNFVVDANNTPAGFFEFGIQTITDSISFNDAVTSTSSLLSVSSTTRGVDIFPSMTTAQRDSIPSPGNGLMIYNLDNNQLNYYNGSAWTSVIGTTSLQNAYNNGNGTITVLNDNSKPFAVGNDETNIFGPYGVYVSATRNLAPSPTQFWFHFLEANDNSSSMVQYGALACQVKDNTAGSVSGLTALGAAIGSSSGEVLPFFMADGLNQQSISTHPLLISDNPGNIIDPASMLDIIDSSHTKGSRPYPSVTTTQRNAIASPPLGLSVYNSTTNTIDYFDGTAWQIGLTLDHLIAGTNITLTQNGDGTVTIDSTGSGPGTEADYSGWAFSNNATVTTFNFSNFDTAIGINAATFDDIVSSNFTNVVSAVSTNNAPIFQYDGSATQFFQCNFNIYVKGTVASLKQYTFEIGILKSGGGGAITDTGFKGNINLSDTTTIHCISLSGIVQLNHQDRVLVIVRNLTDTTSILAAYGNADIINVNATDAVGITWNNVTGTSASMSGENGYVASNAALVSLSLPASCNFGDEIIVDGFGAGGWTITQGSGQQIFYESASTTLGATGTLSSTNSKASVTLRCVVANTTFVVENTTGAITLA